MRTDIPVQQRPPWYFSLLQEWNLAGYRGAVFLLRRLRSVGLLDKCSAYPLGGSESILIPLHFSSLWERKSMEGYEREAIDVFAKHAGLLGDETILVDCGADIGLFSRLVLRQAKNIATVVAFEPNPASYSVLRRNLEKLPIKVVALQAAVSNESGQGRLQSVEGRSSYDNHSKFIQLDPAGSIDVRTIDETLDVTPNTSLAIKIDVEGNELAVLEGAAKSIAAARHVVIQIEAHPDVARRTGVDPIECLKFIHGIRPVRFVVCERPQFSLSLDRLFFDQLDGDAIFNVLATSVMEDDAASAR